MNESALTDHSRQVDAARAFAAELVRLQRDSPTGGLRPTLAASERQTEEAGTLGRVAAGLGVPPGLLANTPRKVILLLVGLGDLLRQVPIDALRLLIEAGTGYHDADERADRGRARSFDRALIVAYDTLIGVHNMSDVDQYARAVGAAQLQGMRDGLWAAYVRYSGDPDERQDRDDRTVVECPRCGMDGTADGLHLSTQRGALRAALCACCQHDVAAPGGAPDAARWRAIR